MIIGILEVDILIPMCHSLKDKRMVCRSLKKKIRNNFNVSVLEADHHEKWQRTLLAIVNVNIDKKNTQIILSKLIDFLNNFSRIQLIDSKIQLL